MNEPNLDDLSKLIPTKFSLVTLAMKRARQLKAGSRPLIDTWSQKPVTIALQEILDEKVRLGPQPPSEVLEREEQEAMLEAIGLSEPTSVSVTRRMEEIFGRDEDGDGEYDEEYYEEEEREDEEEDVEREKELLGGDEEEDEEIGAGGRRGGFEAEDTDTDAATTDEALEEEALELEIEDEGDDDDEDEEEEAAEEEVAPSVEIEAPKKASKTAKAAKSDDEEPPAPKKTAAKSAKAAKAADDEPAAKKTARKSKA